jgi:O-antigen/teichoic acid export membrane protein
MGAIVAIVNLASYVAQYWLYRRLGGGIVLSRRLVSVTTGRELSGYCVSLSIWSFAMLLVSGLDVALVGHFEFGKVAYYSVAATLIVFLAGVQNAVFNVMIPSTAILQARGDAVQLGQAMLTATRYGSFLLLLMGLPLILGAKSILSVWVGPRYADQGARILEMLAAANIIRLSAVPYIMTLIGTGQQRLVTITPLLEGVSNLVVSVIGGFFFGAIGVAIGTLLGGTVGVLGNFVYNMPRTIEINFRISDYVRDGFLRPLVCALPLSGATLAIRVSDFFIGLNGYLLVGAAAVGTAFLLWRWGLVGSERERLRSWYAVLVEA